MTLTPYDTGKRSQPKVWTSAHRDTEDDYGKVDFDDDAGGTVATLYIEKGDDGYALRGHTDEYLTVEIEDQSFNFEDPHQPGMLVVQPTVALQTNVKETIAADLDPRVRDEAEVYWADNGRRAMILVPGEKHVRKQLLIMVTDVGDGEDSSAYVKDWADGVRETRIG